jgi:hypothetical protein
MGASRAGATADRRYTPLEFAAVGVLLMWDRYISDDAGSADEHDMAIALTALRDALPVRLLNKVDEVFGEQALGGVHAAESKHVVAKRTQHQKI